MAEILILDTPQLRVRQSRLASVCLIGFWPGQEVAFARHLETRAGCLLPPDGTQSVTHNTGHAYRIHPHKLLLVSPGDPELYRRLATGFSSALGSLSEQTHGRVLFEIGGAQAARLLQHGLPMDPAHSLKDTTRFVQTRLQDAGVLVCRTDVQSYDVLVPTSFAGAIENWCIRMAKYVTK